MINSNNIINFYNAILLMTFTMLLLAPHGIPWPEILFVYMWSLHCGWHLLATSKGEHIMLCRGSSLNQVKVYMFQILSSLMLLDFYIIMRYTCSYFRTHLFVMTKGETILAWQRINVIFFTSWKVHNLPFKLNWLSSIKGGDCWCNDTCNPLVLLNINPI